MSSVAVLQEGTSVGHITQSMVQVNTCRVFRAVSVSCQASVGGCISTYQTESQLGRIMMVWARTWYDESIVRHDTYHEIGVTGFYT